MSWWNPLSWWNPVDSFANALRESVVHLVIPLFIFLFAILILVFGPKRLFTFIIVAIMFLIGLILLGMIPGVTL